MRRFKGDTKVESGVYLSPRNLRIASLEDSGRLPGSAQVAWYQVPEVLLLVMAPLIGLAYVIFLPLIGFVFLGRVVLEAAAKVVAPAAKAATRVLQPAWQPALAFFGRSRRKKEREQEKQPAERDRWAEKVHEEIDD